MKILMNQIKKRNGVQRTMKEHLADLLKANLNICFQNISSDLFYRNRQLHAKNIDKLGYRLFNGQSDMLIAAYRMN